MSRGHSIQVLRGKVKASLTLPQHVDPSHVLETITLVKAYSALGFIVIPLAPESKTPATRWLEHFPDGRPNVHASLELFKNALERFGAVNIGIAFPGDGWVAVDVDNPAEAREKLPSWAWEALTSTWTVRTRRGFHAYFRAPGRPPRNRAFRTFEVRAQNLYVVAPPSTVAGWRYAWERGPRVELTPLEALLNRTGRKYRIIDPEKAKALRILSVMMDGPPRYFTDALADALGTEIVDAANEPRTPTQTPDRIPTPRNLSRTVARELQRAVELLAPFWTRGQRQNLALAVAGFLHAIGAPKERAAALVHALAHATSDEELKRRMDAVRYTYAKNRRRVRGRKGLEEILGKRATQKIAPALRRLANAH